MSSFEEIRDELHKLNDYIAEHLGDEWWDRLDELETEHLRIVIIGMMHVVASQMELIVEQRDAVDNMVSAMHGGAILVSGPPV
jgi:hypothetical protein